MDEHDPFIDEKHDDLHNSKMVIHVLVGGLEHEICINL